MEESSTPLLEERGCGVSENQGLVGGVEICLSNSVQKKECLFDLAPIRFFVLEESSPLLLEERGGGVSEIQGLVGVSGDMFE